MEIDLLFAQETHVTQNSKEKRKNYTWYLNGSDTGDREFAGMAVIVKNEIHEFIKDVIPHNHRLLEVQLEGTIPTTLVSAYAPQAGRPQAEKTEFYETLTMIVQKINKKGPYLLLGDWNARLQEAENEEEEQWIGEHTFGKHTDTTWQNSEEVTDNREALLELCRNPTKTGNLQKYGNTS